MKLRSWALILFATTALNTGFASVRSYFNHNTSSSYTDPYRNISRSGDNLEAVIVNEINQARRSVFVAVQEFRLPKIAEALVAKKRAGIDVRVILENSYNFDLSSSSTRSRGGDGDNDHDANRLRDLRAFVDMNGNGRIEKYEQEQRDAVYMLKRGGVKVIDDSFDHKKIGSGLMHHKFVVIDDSTVLVSSANFTMSCVHGDMLVRSSRGNPNSLVVIKSRELGDIFAEEFTQMWGNGNYGNFGQSKTYRGPRTVSVRGQKITVQFSPTSSRMGWANSVNGLIGKTLGSAQRSINGALFVFSEQQLSNILEDRNNRGVRMGFIIESKFAYREYSELLDMMGLEIFSTNCKPQANNNPWRKPIAEGGHWGGDNGDVLHHKFAVVDNSAVIMGSQNWSQAANASNDETLLVIESRTISDAYTKEYNRIKRIAEIGVPYYLRRQIEDRARACKGR